MVIEIHFKPVLFHQNILLSIVENSKNLNNHNLLNVLISISCLKGISRCQEDNNKTIKFLTLRLLLLRRVVPSPDQFCFLGI